MSRTTLHALFTLAAIALTACKSDNTVAPLAPAARASFAGSGAPSFVPPPGTSLAAYDTNRNGYVCVNRITEPNNGDPTSISSGIDILVTMDDNNLQCPGAFRLHPLVAS